MPAIADAPAPSGTYYTISTIDAGGRLADRSPIRALHWHPHQPLALTMPTPHTVLAYPDRAGRHAVTSLGYLRLSADLRHACHIAAGDRLLLAACPDHDLLLAYPGSVLDALLLAYHQPSPTEHVA